MIPKESNPNEMFCKELRRTKDFVENEEEEDDENDDDEDEDYDDEYKKLDENQINESMKKEYLYPNIRWFEPKRSERKILKKLKD